MSSNKYDDFGELVWVQPQKPKRKPKKFTYDTLFKQLGEALVWCLNEGEKHRTAFKQGEEHQFFFNRRKVIYTISFWTQKFIFFMVQFY
jgi:hypothetical protein